MQHIEGEDKKKVVLYSLSTCPWCNKTKDFLNDLGVAYDFVDVDLLSSEEDARVSAEIEKFTSDIYFPILVINDKKLIQGFEPEEIRKELE